MEKQTDLRVWGPYPHNLENPNGRLLATAAYLMKHHGYVSMAKELKAMSDDLLKTSPSIKNDSI